MWVVLGGGGGAGWEFLFEIISSKSSTVTQNKLCAFRILVPNLKTINLTFGSLSPILYVKYDLNFGRFFDFILSWS